MSTELMSKRALVTGGASGIGAATAESLAKAGAIVVVADLSKPDVTVERIKLADGVAHGVICDVSDPSSVESLFGAVDELLNGLDIVVNAAGILIESKISDMSIADFDRIVGVNLRGSFLVAQGAARAMNEQKSGRIILISSELAYLGRADFSAYCATKAGVVGLTRSLARELAPHIQVNSVAPGPVDTPMLALENMSPEWREKEFEIPLGRVGTPNEIAAVIRFLCGPDAGFFTGQTISPNGGAVMI